MKKLLLLVSFVIAFTVTDAQAQNNPCLNVDRLQSFNISTGAAATTLVSSNAETDRRIHICSFTIVIAGAAAPNIFTIVYGTGALCATGTVVLATFIGSVTVGNSIVVVSAEQPILRMPAATNLCIISSQAVTTSGIISFIAF